MTMSLLLQKGNITLQITNLKNNLRRDVNLKHTGIKQEPNLAPIQDTHNVPLQQRFSKLQTDM